MLLKVTVASGETHEVHVDLSTTATFSNQVMQGGETVEKRQAFSEIVAFEVDGDELAIGYSAAEPIGELSPEPEPQPADDVEPLSRPDEPAAEAVEETPVVEAIPDDSPPRRRRDR